MATCVRVRKTAVEAGNALQRLDSAYNKKIFLRLAENERQSLRERVNSGDVSAIARWGELKVVIDKLVKEIQQLA